MGWLLASLQDWPSYLSTPYRRGIPALRCNAPYTSSASVHEELLDSWGCYLRNAGQVADDAEWQSLFDARTREADSQEGRLLAEWRDAEIELRVRKRTAAADCVANRAWSKSTAVSHERSEASPQPRSTKKEGGRVER